MPSAPPNCLALAPPHCLVACHPPLCARVLWGRRGRPLGFGGLSCMYSQPPSPEYLPRLTLHRSSWSRGEQSQRAGAVGLRDARCLPGWARLGLRRVWLPLLAPLALCAPGLPGWAGDRPVGGLACLGRPPGERPSACPPSLCGSAGHFPPKGCQAASVAASVRQSCRSCLARPGRAAGQLVCCGRARLGGV